MTDRNNVVIKINYKGSNDSPYKRSGVVSVTEWNIKRIVIALILLIVFIVIPFYYFSADSVELKKEELTIITADKRVDNNLKVVDKEPVKLEKEKEKEKEKEVNTIINNTIRTIEKERTVIDIKPVEKIKAEEIDEPIINSSQGLVDKRVIRALLTTGVESKEPLDVIGSPVIVNKNKATGIFYFTEIIDMKGENLYHRWLWNDKLIYNREINILGNRWRAATSKKIPYSKAGNWSVRLVNNKGIVLNEIKFKVIQQ